MSDLREALKRLVAIYESEHDGDVVRPDWLKAALSAQPQPEAVEPFVQCADCTGTGLAANGIGEPDICKACRGNTVVPSQPEAVDADWRDDPTSDERWSAGLDFAMMQLCAVVGVDPHDVTWDAATEEVEGDVRAVIGNILRAKMGENWSPKSPLAPDERMRRALKHIECATRNDFLTVKERLAAIRTVINEALSGAAYASSASAEARLRDTILLYRGMSDKAVYSGQHVANILETVIALSAGGDEATKSEGDCGAKRCRDLGCFEEK